MGALGSQFVFGVAGTTANGLPAAYLLLESNNPILPQLAMGFVGVAPHEDLGGVHIQKVTRPLPMGLEVFAATVGKVFMISTDLDGLKALIERINSNTSTQVLEKFEPPIDPDAARYLLMALKTQAYFDMASPLVKQLGQMSNVPYIVNDVMIEVVRLLRDIRFLAELNGTWFENRVILTLNPDAK